MEATVFGIVGITLLLYLAIGVIVRDISTVYKTEKNESKYKNLKGILFWIYYLLKK